MKNERKLRKLISKMELQNNFIFDLENASLGLKKCLVTKEISFNKVTDLVISVLFYVFTKKVILIIFFLYNNFHT